MSNEQRRLVTFGRRRGRKLRATKQDLVEGLLPRLAITPDEAASVSGEIWLEIGFGSGEHVLAQARANPDATVIGCEPYVNGMGNLLMQAAEDVPENLRIFVGDARDILDALPDGKLGRVFILFPDPWPKVRHHKRRLIQNEFLDFLAQKMVAGAMLYVATDHVDYLTWMLERIPLHSQFDWQAKRAEDWQTPHPHWVKTRYQQKAEREGRVATFLAFKRV